MVRTTLSGLKKILIREQSEVLSAASVLMILALITKITGMFFTTLFARQFEASGSTDAFFLASVIPEAITTIILVGAISGSIIPIFMKLKESQGESAFIKSFTSTFNTSMLIFVIISIFVAIFAKQLIPLSLNIISNDNQLSSEQLEEVILMMRVMLVPQVILAISAFVSTTLNIYNRFIIPQLAPLLYNVGRILGVLIFVPLMDNSIWGVIVGTIFGALLHLLIQIPLLSYLNVSFFGLYINLKDKIFYEVISLGLPRIISLSAEQISVIVKSVIAFSLVGISLTGEGALTSYQYAIRLMSFPLLLFGTSFAIASFPSLSGLYAKGSKEKFSELANTLIQQVIFLAVPITVIFIVLRVPIVRLIFGILGGAFTWQATLQVSWVVLFFSLGLIFETTRATVLRIFYSIHNTIIPLLSSVFIVVIGIVTAMLFTNYLSNFNTFSIRSLTWDPNYFFNKGQGVAGVGGLGLSSSIVFTLEFVFLIFMLYRYKIIKSLKNFYFEISKKIFVGILMMLFCFAIAKIWEEVLNTAMTIQLIILTGTTMFSSGMIYIWLSYVFKIPEVEIFVTFGINLIQKLWQSIINLIKL
jgi:putative peptidoglycan lipid II flippase